MNLLSMSKKALIIYTFLLICFNCFANVDLYRQARALQRDGMYDEAIVAFKTYLLNPTDEKELTFEQVAIYTDALVQMMNTFQSKGEPEACISTLQDIFNESPILQKQCLRDYYSVLGYALSRTEKMKEAEETMLKVFTIPLYHATPERFFVTMLMPLQFFIAIPIVIIKL